MVKVEIKPGSVASPVIQANERLSFEDDLKSGGLLYCFTVNQLADSMVTLGNPEMTRCQRKSNLICWIRPATQIALCMQYWDLLVSEHIVGFQVKIGRQKFYAVAGEMIAPA